MKRGIVSFVKMRRLIAAALATLIMIEFSQTCFAAESTGHAWRTLPKDTKTAYVRGFLPGFLAGRSQGYLTGFTATYFWAAILVCKNEKDNACINFRKVTPSEAMKEVEELLNEKEKEFESSTDYYVKEIDSFYEAFPLCRGQMLEITLAKLTTMWLGIANSSEDSYNKIGSACGDKK
jgi:hypothetical protein